MKYTRSVPTLLWDETAVRGDVVIIAMRADSPIPHQVRIERAVLEDAVSYSDADLARVARENRQAIEYAIGKAWGEGREQEVVEIGGPGHFVWLNLSAEDFW